MKDVTNSDRLGSCEGLMSYGRVGLPGQPELPCAALDPPRLNEPTCLSQREESIVVRNASDLRAFVVRMPKAVEEEFEQQTTLAALPR